MLSLFVLLSGKVNVCSAAGSGAAGGTHPEQNPGVEPSLHQEGHVEVDEQEDVDPEPHQL